jgi:proteasome lid subunit RPN8/RPN11
MEREVWASYQDVPLVELASDDETEITINFPESDQDGRSEFALWMGNLSVVNEQKQAEKDDRSIEPIADQVQEKEEPVPVGTTEGERDLGHSGENETDVINGPRVELGLVEDAPLLETFDETLEEIDVDVAEPEMVFEERVVGEDVKPPPEVIEPTDIRILGRRRPLGHPTWTAVDILTNEPAFRHAQSHAMSSLDREVAGVLVGPMPEKQPDGRYVVHITDTIIAKYTRMHGASVTYTPESWRYVTDKLMELYPEDSAVIVGWYHTHPGFGIFLSSMDRFIHQNFFVQKWHIALVLDPIASRSGFFCWDRNQEMVDSYEFPWPHWAANSW